MEKLKTLFSQYSGYIVAAFGLLLLAFGYERYEKQGAEAKLITADADKRDAILAQQQDDIKATIQTTQDEAKKEEDRTLTPEETTAYLEKL